MPKILEEGCVATCHHCSTRFSFMPIGVGVTFTKVAAGYSPEEEAYDRPKFTVSCPKCHAATNVERALGPEGKEAAVERAHDSHLCDYDV